MTWDDWTTVWLPMTRGLWPAAPIEDKTVEEWFRVAGAKWDAAIAQLAAADLVEEHDRLPSLAAFRGAYRSAWIRTHPSEPPLDPSEDEKRENAARDRKWWRVIAGMRDHGEIRRLVREKIGTPYDGWAGRVHAADRSGDYASRSPRFAPHETDRILDELIQACDALGVRTPATLLEAIAGVVDAPSTPDAPAERRRLDQIPVAVDVDAALAAVGL